MKIVILSRKRSLSSTRRLKIAARKRGHDVEVVDYLRCYMNITSHRPAVIYQGRALEAVDAAIPRVGASQTFYGTAVVRQFEMMGTYSLNSSLSISRSRDKLRSLQLLARAGVGLPVTGFGHSTKDVNGLIDAVGGPPLVIKLLEGTQGLGLILAETRKAAQAVIEAFRGLDANILVQEYVREAGGSDTRCFVVGKRVVAAVKRQVFHGEMQIGRRRPDVTKTKVTPAERAAAIEAAATLGLSVAAVDMMPSDRGPLVHDVNSSPGLRDLEEATGIDVAGKIIEYIEKRNRKPHLEVPT